MPYLIKSPDGTGLMSNYDGGPAIYGAFNLFQPSSWITCCGGWCSCECNRVPSSWTLDFYDCVGEATCLEGTTVIVPKGFNSLGDPNPCGGVVAPGCGNVEFISVNLNNVFPPWAYCFVGVRFTNPAWAHPCSTFFIGPGYVINTGWVVNNVGVSSLSYGDCYLPGTAIGLSTVCGTHGFTVDVTPNV